MTSSEKIKEMRLKKGMTQKELSEKCSINDANLRKYESGRQKPKLDTLRKIANALEVPVWELVDDEDLGNQPQSKPSSDAEMVDYMTTADGNDVLIEPDRQFVHGDLLNRLLANKKAFEQISATLTEEEQSVIFPEAVSVLISQLNKDGKEKAIQYLMDIVRIPDYKE